MAGFEVYNDKTDFDALLEMDFDSFAEKALNEAAPVLEASMKSAVQASVKHTGDSGLVRSIKAGKAKKSKNGAWIVTVGPKGYSKVKIYRGGKKKNRVYPVSNALKAIWKEYGIAGHQPSSPFLAKAVNDAEKETLDIIQRTFDRKAGG